MNVNKINNMEIPYHVLETFGLTRNMIDDLPIDVLSRILAGQRSPVLPVAVKGLKGEVVQSRARFSLVYAPDGNVDVVFHPVVHPIGEKMCVVVCDPLTGKEALTEVDTKTMYSDEVVKGLNAGKVVMDYTMASDGRKVKAFLQLDPETNEVLSVPTSVIGRNIQTLVGEFGLTLPETYCIENGDILTIMQGDEPVSVGLDLNSPTGLRFEKGPEKRWKEAGVRQWNKYSVGVFGCWRMDDGVLSYIEEEDYTEDIWDEIERQRNNRMKNQQSHKL